MNFQLIIVAICLLAAVIFIARKVIGTLRRKGRISCASCPNEKLCSNQQGAARPPCSLQELRPAKSRRRPARNDS